MMTVFLIVLILACVILSLIVLIQNPKGGGLAGNIAGISNQFMGVKQTNDVLEKGTWIFASVIGVLCLVSTLFITGKEASGIDVGTAPPPTQQQSGGAPVLNNPNAPQSNPDTVPR